MKPETVKIKIKRGNEIKEFEITPYEVGPKAPRLFVARKKSGKINDDIYYVDLQTLSMSEINEIIPQLVKAKGIIFDLRGYPNGNKNIIRHLIDKPVKSARWQVPEFLYPDRDKKIGWDPTGRWVLDPKEPRLKGKIVFLINARAISYAESFMGIIEAYKLAEIIGEPTAGTNGNVNVIRLPGDYDIYFTGMKVLKHDGSQHHLIGIQPTIPLKSTVKGIIEGRDEILEKAIEVINSSI
jgi:C-terminal processing protease CtpA/Prc